VKKQTRLRLVSESEDAALRIFDDIDKLRADVATTAPSTPAQPESPSRSRRAREVETFARIPHNRALKLGLSLDGAAWQVLIELDRLILSQYGKNPVLLWSKRLRSIGLVSGPRIRALRQLEEAGVVTVKRRGKGLSLWVTHLWYPLKDA
jgi:hypothetical protein